VPAAGDFFFANLPPFFLYVSGSAYKIVNSRAYHHGTMLISTQLDTLGDLLRVANKVSNALSFHAFHPAVHPLLCLRSALVVQFWCKFFEPLLSLSLPLHVGR
jgi:hypothetical protein